MSDVIIRPAQSADAVSIVALWNAVITDTAITFATDLKTTAGVTADIAQRGAGFLVAENDQGFLGFATYFPFRSGPGYRFTREHSVMLTDMARGQGVGRRLMTALEQTAKAEGIHSLLAGVSGENPHGVAFHARLGFDTIARLPEVGFKFDRWMDLILMQKKL